MNRGVKSSDRTLIVATGVSLILLILWEASGLDLVLSRQFGAATGFAARDAWWASGLLHDGGRWLAGGVLAGLVLGLWRPRLGGLARRDRLLWLVVMLGAMLLVPLLKRFSDTSCPWSLAEFGGVAAYVPHWRLGVADGGTGHCFPSGHAVSAFAFFGLYFMWRGSRPRVARVALAVVLLLGALYGWGQMARGAHFASHTLWSAWLCWTWCLLFDRAATRWLHPSPVARGSGTIVGWHVWHPEKSVNTSTKGG